MKINTCSTCGGRIEFSPKDRAVKCLSCGTNYPIKYKQLVAKHPIDWVPEEEKLLAWSDTLRTKKCDNCGAEVVFEKYDIATNCKYCNTNVITSLKSLPGLQPEKVIPFNISKNKAKDAFAKNVRKRHFLPLDFKKNLPKTEIQNSYISSFNFECDVVATYNGRKKITTSYRDSKGVSRSKTEYRNFSGTIKKSFPNVLVESSNKLNQNEITQVYPYDFQQSFDYDEGFVIGYNVGYYNQNINIAEQNAKDIIRKDIEKEINRLHSNIVSLTINPQYNNIRYNYTLLPLYFVKYNYKNKPYINVMNGQTGATGGDVPRSKTQITLFTLFIILIVSLPLLFIFLSN